MSLMSLMLNHVHWKKLVLDDSQQTGGFGSPGYDRPITYHWIRATRPLPGMFNKRAFLGFRSHLALQTIRVNPIYVFARKPSFFPGNDFHLDLPTAFIAQVHISAIRFSERLVGPHLANGKANRPVLTRANVYRLAVPTRVALLANRQGTFLSKMPRVRCREIPLLGSNGCCSLIHGSSLFVPMHSFLPTNGRLLLF